MKDEIAAGIRNALDRGSTIEEAMESYVNAGYNSNDVKEAAQAITSGAISISSPQQNNPQNSIIINAPEKQLTSVIQSPAQQNQSVKQSPQQVYEPVPKSTKPTKTVILIVILILLVGVLGGTILFSNKIAALFS